MASPRTKHFDTGLALYCLIVPIILFEALCLCGCVSASPGLSNLFLYEFNDGSQSIRIGYLGICVVVDNVTTCRTSIGANPASLQQSFGTGSDSIQIMSFAAVIQSKLFLLLPAIPGVFFTIGVLLLMLLKRAQKQNHAAAVSRLETMKIYCMSSLLIALAFALSSSIGCSQALPLGQALNTLLGQTIAGNLLAGTTVLALQWSCLGLITVFLYGTFRIMYRAKNGHALMISAKAPGAVERSTAAYSSAYTAAKRDEPPARPTGR